MILAYNTIEGDSMKETDNIKSKTEKVFDKDTIVKQLLITKEMY